MPRRSHRRNEMIVFCLDKSCIWHLLCETLIIMQQAVSVTSFQNRSVHHTAKQIANKSRIADFSPYDAGSSTNRQQLVVEIQNN